ncbi:DUF3971 domain-containing protein, partial [Rickettsiales bacterium]|nr:DUF3971 domain-containing protein [Rickettsiales bacterium]
MIKTIAGFLIKTISVLSIVAMLSIAGFMAWIIAEPRSIPSITSYVEKEVSGLTSKYNLEIGDSFIGWNKYEKAFSIYIKDVTILDYANDTIANLPQLYFNFSVAQILRGEILSSEITLIEPVIYLNSSEDEIDYVQPKSERLIVSSWLNKIYENVLSKSNEIPISSINIKDGILNISTNRSDLVWNIQNASIHLNKTEQVNWVGGTFELGFGQDQAKINITLMPSQKKDLDISLILEKLPSYALQDLLPGSTILQKLNLYFDGGVKLIVSLDGEVSQLNLDISKAYGVIDYPEVFLKPVTIKNAVLKGNLYKNFSSMSIDKIEADFNGPKIKIYGLINDIDAELTNPENPAYPDVDLYAEIENLKVDNLKNYWPVEFRKTLRSWIVDNIHGGTVNKAKGHFILTPKDFHDIAKRREIIKTLSLTNLPNEPVISKKSIDAYIDLDGTNVSYSDAYPALKNIKGKVVFDGHSMNAKIEKGTLKGLNVKEGNVAIKNIWQKPLRLSVDTKFSGAAEDLNYFTKPTNVLDKNNELTLSVSKLTGNVDGNISLDFPIIKEIDFNDLNLIINAKFDNLKLPKLYNKNDFSNATIDFLLNKNKLLAKGKGDFSDLPAYINYELPLNHNEDFEYKYNIKASPSNDQIEKLGFTKLPNIVGNFAIDINALKTHDKLEFTGDIDLSKSIINVPSIGYQKAAGEKWQAEFIA